LKTKNPPLSRIDEFIISDFSDSLKPDFLNTFVISESSEGASGNSIIPPDTAICDDCLAEIRSEDNRRFMYPFTVCTNCGPRYTTVKKLPYDRKNTTMDDFPLCSACSLEYRSVDNRRYHAQPTCCPDCGPLHSFIGAADRNSVLSLGNEALKDAAKAIDSGKIIALKGDGGFHLVCDAFSEEAVSALRQRLDRPMQPFAVMIREINAAQKIAQIREEPEKEAFYLKNIRRPIVVCNKRPAFNLAPSVVPVLHNIGIMLPYSGTHHVLFKYLKTDAVVMTSANLPGRPMVLKTMMLLSNFLILLIISYSITV
jgi:Hydrogenase maturation factor